MGIPLFTQDFWWERRKKGPAKVLISGIVLSFESLSLHVYSLIPKVWFKDMQQVRASMLWWKSDKWETDDSCLYNVLCSPHKERAVHFSASYPVMFYRAKWRAMIQTILPFYQPILSPHRLSTEAEFIAELFALESKCTNSRSQDASLVSEEEERRNITDVYQKKMK